MDAVKLGLFQALALIPGTSRSGATIIGGLLSGLSRAHGGGVLVLPGDSGAAGGHRLRHLEGARTSSPTADVEPLIVSCVVSFISALLVTKLLLRFVSRHSFAAFAWYRIVFGGIILVTAYTGVVQLVEDIPFPRSSPDISTSSKFPFPGHARCRRNSGP